MNARKMQETVLKYQGSRDVCSVCQCLSAPITGESKVQRLQTNQDYMEARILFHRMITFLCSHVITHCFH